jgi:hypothetical protein
MGRKVWLAALFLPLSGCYVPQQGPGYAPQPDYGAAGYGTPAYASPGYPPGYDPYSSYNYDNGAPMIVEGGVSVPLVLFGGEWGYYDHDRHFHRAPDNVRRDIESHRASGNFRPNPGPSGGGGPQPWHGQPGGQAGFHPGGPPPGQVSGPPPRGNFQPNGVVGFHPGGPPPGQVSGPPPRGNFQPNNQAGFHPGGPPPGQGSGPPPRANFQPQQQPQQRPEGRHECPPGQRC